MQTNDIALNAPTRPPLETVLADCRTKQLQFSLTRALMKEERFLIALTRMLIKNRALGLDYLITNQVAAQGAPDAYRTAFEDPSCLKIILNWETPS